MNNNQIPQTILRGQMWWVDLPQDESNPHCQYGLRPVVVISNDKGNAHSPTVLVCPLTTQQDSYYHIHPNVMCRKTLSYVLCEQIRVIDKKLLTKYIGKIRKVEQDYIDRALVTAVGLPTVKNSENREVSVYAEIAAVRSTNHILEEKVAKLEKQLNAHQEMAELGTHVKGIIDILFNHTNSPVSRPVIELAQNIMEDNDKLLSKPDNKPTSHDYQSGLMRFNKRYDKYKEIEKSSSVDPTQFKPKVNQVTKSSTIKWNDARIKEFVDDYPTMATPDLLRKYQLRSASTAARYWCKFRKHESL